MKHALINRGGELKQTKSREVFMISLALGASLLAAAGVRVLNYLHERQKDSEENVSDITD